MTRPVADGDRSATPATGRRRRRRVLALVAALTAGLAALALAELLVRALSLVSDNVPIRYLAVDGPEVVAPRPFDSATSLGGVLHRVNSLGLRSPERSVQAPPGVARIVVVGDSVTWGQGVAVEDGFVSRLEEVLQARGRRAEAWNLGVPATNAFNHAARLARLAPVLRPDVTVVVLLYNDLETGPARFRVT
jgi:hypothetical protein